MSKMFNDKAKSLFLTSKPRMVDGCCEPVVCCGGNSCEYRFYYRVFDGASFGPEIDIDGSPIDIGTFEPDHQIRFYIQALSGDVNITSITETPISTGTWAIFGSLPTTILEGSAIQIASYFGATVPGIYETGLQVETSCGNESIILQLEVINDLYCQYDVRYIVYDYSGGVRNAEFESGDISWSTGPGLGSLVLSSTYLLNNEYEIVFFLNPVSGSSGVTATSASFSGNFTPLVNNTPIFAPQVSFTEISSALMSTTTEGLNQGTVGITTDCGNDFSYEIFYNVLA